MQCAVVLCDGSVAQDGTAVAGTRHSAESRSVVRKRETRHLQLCKEILRSSATRMYIVCVKIVEHLISSELYLIPPVHFHTVPALLAISMPHLSYGTRS